VTTVVSGSKRLILLLGAAAIGGGYAPSHVGGAQNAFHVTFGTSGNADGGNADGAAFLVETTGGDIVVAGSGASFWSDDGRRFSNPMLARFDGRGELRWQRVYVDLADQRVIAFASRGEDQYVVLEREQRLQRDASNEVTLRQIDESGIASEPLASLQGLRVLAARPVVEAGLLSHFIIAGSNGAGVQILRVDLRGLVTEAGSVRDFDRISHAGNLSEQDFLVSRLLLGHEHVLDGRAVIDNHTDLIRLRPTGEVKLLARVADKLCRHAAASSDQVVCVEAPLLRIDQTSDAIVAYSAAGQELWRRALAPGVYVEHMEFLASGDLLYAHREAQNVVVNLVDSSGRQVGTRTLRSTGPYTFLNTAEILRDGRLALAGSTGPWNGFTSTDTNAMLIVMSGSAGDLAQEPPEIEANIVTFR
jgi:hypothetical protein